MRSKLGQLPTEKGRVLPYGGWKASTWYVVHVSYRSTNPIHEALLYTGFLDSDGNPGAYSALISATTPSSGDYNKYGTPYFLEAGRALWTPDRGF
jgi:hypothetical protein